jgi:hypothetical protein
VRITFSEATPGTVYRALREDVPHPIVTIADGPGYDEVHRDGDPDGRGGVILIEPFGENCVTAWHQNREQLSAQRGYMGSRLLHSGGGYVAISRWSSPLMYARATRETDTAITWQPALYLSD